METTELCTPFELFSEELTMPNRLGPLEVTCDAPPYNIVRACQMIGLKSPEDVRWTRLSHLPGPYVGGNDPLKPSAWRSLLGMSQPETGICTCRQKLPPLERYTFTLISGKQTSYLITQCSRCLTIYWHEG